MAIFCDKPFHLIYENVCIMLRDQLVNIKIGSEKNK